MIFLNNKIGQNMDKCKKNNGKDLGRYSLVISARVC